jgi:hypothetical protein
VQIHVFAPILILLDETFIFTGWESESDMTDYSAETSHSWIIFR